MARFLKLYKPKGIYNIRRSEGKCVYGENRVEKVVISVSAKKLRESLPSLSMRKMLQPCFNPLFFTILCIDMWITLLSGVHGQTQRACRSTGLEFFNRKPKVSKTHSE